MRPRLLPGLRRLWRDERTIQLGTDPATAVVLELRRPGLARVLDLLDGSRTLQRVFTEARPFGVDGAEVLDLVEALRATGMVVAAHEMLPTGLRPDEGDGLTTEAAAISLRLRAGLTGADRGGPESGAEPPPVTTTQPTAAASMELRPVSAADRASEAATGRATSAGEAALELQPVSGAARPTEAARPTAAQVRPMSGAERPTVATRSGTAGARRQTAAGVLRRRRAARVIVAGDGPLVAPLAAALAGAGVGHVEPVVEGRATAADVAVGGLARDDVAASRFLATSTAIARHAPWVRVTPGREDGIDFVVRVGDRRLDALDRRGVRLHLLPRLEVRVRLGTVIVGPLVRPTRSPCRGCLELHRQDRDPAWPALAAQLATAPPGIGEPCSLTTAMAGAAFAADEVLSYLDGIALRTEAAIVEIPRPGEIRRREWTAHPRCDCRRRRRTGPKGQGVP
ncbi:hypothetical protein ACPPVO_05410 [Dactylosporangium sp. McL0621]|uniref:hypothetical protein n=1 Tax=Dactylosporangium sp. McL0621 TaxID=3415678 RepID=UPI003CF9ECDB